MILKITPSVDHNDWLKRLDINVTTKTVPYKDCCYRWIPLSILCQHRGLAAQPGSQSGPAQPLAVAETRHSRSERFVENNYPHYSARKKTFVEKENLHILVIK